MQLRNFVQPSQGRHLAKLPGLNRVVHISFTLFLRFQRRFKRVNGYNLIQDACGRPIQIPFVIFFFIHHTDAAINKFGSDKVPVSIQSKLLGNELF